VNIFFLDKDPLMAARYHHDVHLNKMILETAQLLSTAHHQIDGMDAPQGIYKQTHVNHPSAAWARSSIYNYSWTLRLLRNLLEEYEWRKEKQHATDKLFNLLILCPKKMVTGTFTLPPLCMPDKFKTANLCFDDTVEAYRRYYRYAKRHDKKGKFIAHYTKREPPTWLN
jgi:hypothetical protein